MRSDGYLDSASDTWYNRVMGKSIKLRAFAKANLSLNITGYDETSGNHTLDGFMMSLDAFDIVTLTERADAEINVKFVNADIGEDNTAYRAAKTVHDIIGGCGYDITVEKGIPVGAGLGGSSADGAAVLRALDVLYRLPERGVDMRKTALGIGSDVPFMLTGGLARVRGTGEDLFFVENKLELFIVGLMSGNVSTAAAYKKFDALYPEKSYCPTDNEKMFELLLSGSPDALGCMGNALYAPAAALLSDIERNAKALRDCGATVNLTGSGGMVLGYFTDMEKFYACTQKLGDRDGFHVFAPVKTGVLHERLD